MTAPSHYLNQCWNIFDWTLRNKIQWNPSQNSFIFIPENEFENVVCKMAAILSRPQCVDKHPSANESNTVPISRLILGLRPANERQRYFVTTSLIGWVQTKNQSWIYKYIPRNRHMVCFVMFRHWSMYPSIHSYPSGILHWPQGHVLYSSNICELLLYNWHLVVITYEQINIHCLGCSTQGEKIIVKQDYRTTWL